MNLNIMTTEDATRLTEAVKASPKSAETIASEGQAAVPGNTPQVSADDVYTQILKYIPSALIGLYLLIVNVLVGSISSKEIDAKRLWCGVTFGVFLLLIPIFLRSRKVARWSQIVISMLAFAAWAAASPGIFELIKGYPDWIGTIALALALALFVSFRVSPLPENVINDSAP